MASETVVSDHCTASEEVKKKVESKVKKIETEKISATSAADPVTESLAKIDEKINDPISEDSVRVSVPLAESTERNIEDKTIDAPPSEEEKKTEDSPDFEVKDVQQVAKVTETLCDENHEEFKVELVEEKLPKIVDVHESSAIEEVEVNKLKDDLKFSEPEEISKSSALVEERTVDDVKEEESAKVEIVATEAVEEISKSAPLVEEKAVKISQFTETTIHQVEEETEIFAIDSFDEVKSDSVESQFQEKGVECSPIVEAPHKVIETEAETETPRVQSQEKIVEVEELPKPENIEEVSGESVVEAGKIEEIQKKVISQEESVVEAEEFPKCEKIEAESEKEELPEYEKIEAETGVKSQEKSIQGESLQKSEAECEIPKVEVETPIKLVEEEETDKVETIVIESSNEVKSDAIEPQVEEKDVECSPIVEVEEKSEEKVVDTSKIEAETEIPQIKYAEECVALPENKERPEEKIVETPKFEAKTEIPEYKSQEECVIAKELVSEIESQEESVVAEKLTKYEEIEAETKILEEKSVSPEELNKCEEQNPMKDIELVPENGKKGETQVEEKLEESTKVPPKIEETVQIDETVKTEQVNEETKTYQDAPKKQSNNIIKMVKHSLVKAKKAIIGKSHNSKSTASEQKEDAKE